MKRIGSILGIKKEYLETYKLAHDNYWPELKEILHKYNMQNFSIFYRGNTLYSYYEYCGSNYLEDLKKWQSCELVRIWNEEMAKYQEPIPESLPGEWWADMTEVFHVD